MLKKTDALILNRKEFDHLRGIGFDATTKGNPGILLVTEGALGCAVHTKNTETQIPAYQADAVDPSGAGDAFNAGFIAGRIKGFDVYESVRMGNAVAAFAVEKWGCQTNLPSWEEAERRIRGEKTK
ncbi:putative sugar kinase [uncultured archaeon]|nr:putative sugar kinase [uncultured archaeon]